LPGYAVAQLDELPTVPTAMGSEDPDWRPVQHYLGLTAARRPSGADLPTRWGSPGRVERDAGYRAGHVAAGAGRRRSPATPAST
jgi:hypothetical protein